MRRTAKIARDDDAPWDGKKPAGKTKVLRSQKKRRASTVEIPRPAFVTLDDETGTANEIIWPAMFEKHPLVITWSPRWFTGKLQNEAGVIHVVAECVESLPALSVRVASSHDYHKAAEGGRFPSGPSWVYRGWRMVCVSKKDPGQGPGSRVVDAAVPDAALNFRRGHGDMAHRPRDVRQPGRDFRRGARLLRELADRA